MSPNKYISSQHATFAAISSKHYDFLWWFNIVTSNRDPTDFPSYESIFSSVYNVLDCRP